MKSRRDSGPNRRGSGRGLPAAVIESRIVRRVRSDTPVGVAMTCWCDGGRTVKIITVVLLCAAVAFAEEGGKKM